MALIRTIEVKDRVDISVYTQLRVFVTPQFLNLHLGFDSYQYLLVIVTEVS